MTRMLAELVKLREAKTKAMADYQLKHKISMRKVWQCEACCGVA